MVHARSGRSLPRPRTSQQSIAILTWHSISHGNSPVQTSPSLFRQQMHALARAGFRGITLGDALLRRQTRQRNERVVALTFDDGFADFAEMAWPILKSVGFNATVFPVTGRLGNVNDWPGQPSWAPRLPLLDRAQMRSLASEGVEFGSHSVSHHKLPSLAVDTLAGELARSRRSIEQITDRPCYLFAYPYGAVSPSVRLQAAEHYSAAVSTELRVAGPDEDLFMLPRIDAFYLRPAWLTAMLYQGTGKAYLALRRAGRRLRRATIGAL